MARANQIHSSPKAIPGQPSMADLLASTGYNIPTLRRGQEVKGKIVEINSSEVLIDVGGKSEGIVSGRELSSAGNLASMFKVGDTVDATVIYQENDAGQVVLSLKKLSFDRRWQELEEKRNNKEDVEVAALEANRGGLICEYFGIRGFLPASQLAASQKLEDLLGKQIWARVIEVDRATNRLILSQKTPGKQDLEKLLKLLAKVKIGEKFAGTISAILPFGIFVELKLDEVVGQSGSRAIRKSEKIDPDSQITREPGDQAKLEGLVHISEVSWEKVDDLAKMFKVGDKVDVMVIAKDEASGRLNLSIKQLLRDPFAEASSKYAQDQQVTGTIAKVTPYGVFVNLEDPSGLGASGIEGLMHISKIPPNVEYKVGEAVECTIEAVDVANRRISLIPVVREKPILYR